ARCPEASMKLVLVACFAAAQLPIAQPAHSVELKVLAASALTGPLSALAVRFEQATGHRVSLEFAPAPALIRLATSAPFDIAITPHEALQDSALRGVLAPGPIVDIARVGYGVGVRAGAARPDVSTAAAFRQTMLNARSITLVPESVGGRYIFGVFE